MQFLQALPVAPTEVKTSQANPAYAHANSENQSSRTQLFSDVFEGVSKDTPETEVSDQALPTKREAVDKAHNTASDTAPEAKTAREKTDAVLDETPQDQRALDSKDPHEVRDQIDIDQPDPSTSAQKTTRIIPVLEGMIMPSLVQPLSKVMTSLSHAPNAAELGNNALQIDDNGNSAPATGPQSARETETKNFQTPGLQIRQNTPSPNPDLALNAVRLQKIQFPDSQASQTVSLRERTQVTASEAHLVPRNQHDSLGGQTGDIKMSQSPTATEKQLVLLNSQPLAQTGEGTLSDVTRPPVLVSAENHNIPKSETKMAIAETGQQKTDQIYNIRQHNTGIEKLPADEQISRIVPEERFMSSVQQNSAMPRQQNTAPPLLRDGDFPTQLHGGQATQEPSTSRTQQGSAIQNIPINVEQATLVQKSTTGEKVFQRDVEGHTVPKDSDQTTALYVVGKSNAWQSAKTQISGQGHQRPSFVTDSTANLSTGDLEIDPPLSDELGSLPGTDHPRATTQNMGLAVGKADMPQHIPRQLAEVVHANNGKSVDVALSPEELGRVKLSIVAADNGVVVSILAERPETLELLRRHIDQLNQELRELGYQNPRFSFSNENPDPGRDRSSSLTGDSPNADQEIQLPRSTANGEQPSTGPQAGLDLRI
ncbi:flagellar hook-length control protein FliK [Roseobacter sp. GAI101]|uniref:flagellar hook-length control protein FliK n=1 Tax=Roseobacter sp. (strain GAI101) TaxID=391589 RepID=UPI0002F4C1E4|nr:flagellar hook-length control protein FliK [Roseobacter sp. GAI101]